MKEVTVTPRPTALILKASLVSRWENLKLTDSGALSASITIFVRSAVIRSCPFVATKFLTVKVPSVQATDTASPSVPVDG